MDMAPSPAPPAGDGRRRLRLLYSALALLVLAPLSLWPGQYYGGAARLLNIASGAQIDAKDREAGLHAIASVYRDSQYTILVVVLSLTLLYSFKSYPILWSLSRAGL